jgi:hypothetical protein
MRLRRFVLGLAVCWLCLPAAARAILIETGGARVGGYFVRDDGKKLTLRVRTPNGKEKEQVYDRSVSKIKILHQLDRKRLEGLSRDNPTAYRDYAEELARQTADPEARDTAMRLYLIAAYLDPQKLAQGSLHSMSLLAGTPAEARKCRALAFLLDPKSDASALKTEAVKPAQVPKAQASALQDFLQALHYYRLGRVDLARKYARREGMDTIFSLVPGMIDQKTFLQRCNDANCTTCKTKGKVLCAACNGKGVAIGPFGRLERCSSCNGLGRATCTACDGTGVNLALSDDVLRQFVRAELWAVDQLAGGDGRRTKGSGATSWSSVLQARQLSPVLPLSLETITEFDPRKCHYRNGTWVAPGP